MKWNSIVSIFRIAAAILILSLNTCFSQPDGTIFPDTYGADLVQQLRTEYKPQTVLSYDTARDTMYAVLDNQDGSLTCVYSGYTISLNPNADPSTDAYHKDINAEHTWPQSKGADSGNAKSDLHHLYPCRAQVNSSRGNTPYAEIDDDNTDTWWRLNTSSSSVPGSNIDEYSEKENSQGLFEPREDHKGNAARSVFYFYTMYESQADSDFFEQQKDILREWNLADEVDSRELARSARIAGWQSGKENPFVLDTTLVRRAYFHNSSGSGETQPAAEGDIVITEIMQNPNAVYDSDGEWFELYNAGSKNIDINGWYIKDAGSNSHQINNGGPLVISASSRIVLGRNASPAVNGGVETAYQYSGIDIGNNDDEIYLYLPDETTLIDKVEYDGGSFWPDPTGASMIFTGGSADDNNDPARWTVSDKPWTGSAGDFGSPNFDNNSALDISSAAGGVPQSFNLTNYPNPFNPTTAISYKLSAVSRVELIIYDLIGRKIAELVNENQTAGDYDVKWNADGNAGGVYFYVLKIFNTENSVPRIFNRKMMLLK